ncbi:MAG TPA: hypothetical protein VIF02_12135 [Methylocella sp.]|jgi:hypothetical protein
MDKGIVSGFAAMGMAAMIIVPLSYGAKGRETRSERSASTINQSTDRADAHIAILKAELHLSSDQTQHWAGLESALHDIAAKRAKSWAASNELQTGRASSNSPGASDTIAEDEREQGIRSEREERKARPDDIDEMRREADAYTVQAADLRQIADAVQPLYETLDDRQRHQLVQFVREDMRANVMDDRHDRHDRHGRRH